MSEEILQLQNDQKLLLLKEWNGRPENPPSIAELIKLAFPDLKDEEIDARNKHGRLIREFLATAGVKTPPAAYKAKGLLELTTEQKEYIVNNCSNMKSFEMARVLFNNNLLTSASQEARTVYNFVKGLDKKIICDKPEDLPEEYSPPKTLDRVVARINKYVDGANWDFKKLTPKQKKQCESLINYLHYTGFQHQINLYKDLGDKKLFEANFIECVYNKEDLQTEDVHQYIMVATDKVTASSIQKTIIMLEEEQKRVLDEEGKMSMALVEAIKTSRDEFNSCTKRQQSLYKTLTEERSKRLSERIGPAFTLLNIIEEVKNEETRNQLLKIAEERNDKIKQEIDRFSKLSETIVRIYGVNEDLIING